MLRRRQAIRALEGYKRPFLTRPPPRFCGRPRESTPFFHSATIECGQYAQCSAPRLLKDCEASRHEHAPKHRRWPSEVGVHGSNPRRTTPRRMTSAAAPVLVPACERAALEGGPAAPFISSSSDRLGGLSLSGYYLSTASRGWPTSRMMEAFRFACGPDHEDLTAMPALIARHVPWQRVGADTSTGSSAAQGSPISRFGVTLTECHPSLKTTTPTIGAYSQVSRRSPRSKPVRRSPPASIRQPGRARRQVGSRALSRRRPRNEDCQLEHRR